MIKSISKGENPAEAIPQHVRELLGNPPLLGNEDPQQYYVLMAELAGAVDPADIVEWLWIRDVTDLATDILRYRRFKAALVNRKFLDELIESLAGDQDSGETDGEEEKNTSETGDDDSADDCANDADNDIEDIATRYFTSREARREIAARLKARGLDVDAIYAQVLQELIGDIEQAERLMASAEIRRDRVLREIQRYRSGFGYSLRQASDRIVESEVPLVPLPER